MEKSRNMAASTSLYPGPLSELTLTRPSRPEGPPPAGHPADETLQYAVVSNHCFFSSTRDPPLSTTWANLPGRMFGRSLLSPSKLSSVPLVMAKGLPLRIETMAEIDQPFS